MITMRTPLAIWIMAGIIVALIALGFFSYSMGWWELPPQ